MRHKSADNHVVIMAGGSGQRFWPWSTQSMPKQFHDFLGTGQTLLQATAARFQPIIADENIWVVTHQRYVKIVQQQLPWLNPQQILAEPMAKNTAPCIAYACHIINQRFPTATLILTPADHQIQHQPIFITALQQALAFQDHPLSLILLGVPCQSPATGYGYIAYYHTEQQPLKTIKAFVEKPPRQQAEDYLQSGNYVWNTGIFIGKVAAFIKRFQIHLPHIWQPFERLTLSSTAKKKLSTCLIDIYKSLPDLSFDQGILEQTNNLYVVCADFRWTDLGTWNALYEHLPHDPEANVCQGQVVTLATHNCLIKANEQQLIATYGLDNLIIVQQGKVLLICPKDEVQNLKSLIKKIRDEHDEKYL